MNACGCHCICHGDEGPDWPGPCAGCCEPGDECKCGIARRMTYRDVAQRLSFDDICFGGV